MPKAHLQPREDDSEDAEKVLPADLIAADDAEEETEDEETLDVDEVDPFKDKWEE